MIQTSANPLDPARTPPRYSDDELKRLRNETRALLTVAVNGTTARIADLMQPAAPNARLALLERVKQELAEAQAEFARKPEAARAASRFACDALRLFRVCARETCRKAQTCRGNPAACHARAGVPEPVNEWVATLLVAERAPGLALVARGHAPERLAYECWIAGIEARAACR